MKKPFQIFTLTIALLGLSGCGFTPMYAKNGANQSLQATFSAVEVAPIPERLGQIVRNHLLDRINPFGGSATTDYVLQVALEKENEGFGFRSDEAITRNRFILEANFQLIDVISGEVVLQDLVRSVHAYDVVQSDFANFSAEQDAEARTALQVSDLVTARLGLFFKSKE